LDEGVRMVQAEADLDQDLAGRDSPGTPPGFADVESNLLVARATKALLFCPFADRPADVRRTLRPACEAVDLVEEPLRDSRGEEAHEPYRAGETVSRVSQLRAETVLVTVCYLMGSARR
jgi:hypothetical protein